MKNFYQSIFNKPDVLEGKEAIANFLTSQGDIEPLLEFNRRKLNDVQRDSLEGHITLEELTSALHEDMKGSSAPGIDGFTVNFVREFWTPLGGLVRNAVNTSKSKGELTSTMRFAIFKLLRKGDKDPTLAANFRPISLLSVIYKLFSCVIKNRLKKVLPTIIGKQQKAYVENDNIGSVLLNLLTSMKKSNEKKIANLILCVDFRKAFDSISHTYIQNALKNFNFGEDFCDWIQLFFCNREGRILMNGHLTDKILLEQGVPQGDIISPYIFIIAVEYYL